MTTTPTTHGAWAHWTLLAILILGAIRTGVLALGLAPLHFDEAQYWSYGEALDWGYYSKPPMTAWLIRLSSDIFGDTLFGVRAFVPWIHGLIAWLIFATGRRLFDGRTGFWAALAYLLLPAVTVSSTIMSTDPPMMAAWAGALYALIRALQAEQEKGETALIWWALVGVAIGLGLNSKYTIIAFVGGALGYALFSREGRWADVRWGGPLLAVLAALIVWAPNLWWNYQHDFASIRHVGDNAKMSEGPGLRPDKLGEFFGAQIAIFGPILFMAAIGFIGWGRWRHEWSYRLLLWFGLPLFLAMHLQAFLSRAHPNWAAPAYIALTLIAVAWLLDREKRGWLLGHAALGVAVLIGFTALALPYRESPTDLPRLYDPFKKNRPEALLCAKAMPLLQPSERIVSNSRRVLAVCMFEAGLGIEAIRITSGPKPGNHYQLAAPLRSGEEGDMLVVLETDAPEAFLAQFEQAEIIETGVMQPHGVREGGKARPYAYTIGRVSGYRGAGPAEDAQE